MPASNVQNPFPLTRLNSLFPGQMGVPGGWTDTGLRDHVTGTVFYVDPNYPGVDSGADGTDPTNPLPTIAAALAKCHDFRGDMICVMANDGWQYGPKSTAYTTVIEEDVVVTVHGVRIVGVAPSSPTGVIWRPATAGGVACTVQALDVLIEGFCFSESSAGVGGGTGIFGQWDGVTYWGDNGVVRNCFFDDSLDVGIDGDFCWGWDIHHNRFEGCDSCGIYQDPAKYSAWEYAHIHENSFTSCGEGALGAINVDDGNFNTVWGNSFYNGNAVAAAAATDEGINFSSGNDNFVYNNWFSCLLPVPANGDWDDFNSAGADAWVGNHCMDGLAVTNPT